MEVTSATTTASVTEDAREATTAQFALSSAPASRPMMKPPKPSAARRASPAPADRRAPPRRLPAREDDDADDDEADPSHCGGVGTHPASGVERERRERPRGGDRRDDAHRAEREAAIERREPDTPAAPPASAGASGDPGEGVARHERPGEHADEPDALRDGEDDEDGRPTGAMPPQKSPRPSTRRRRAREERPSGGVSRAAAARASRACRASSSRASVVADGPCRRLGVELVRVVEDGGLGGLRRRAVVVARDGVEQLGEDRRVEVVGALLEHSQSEVHVTEQLPFVGLPEGRARAELANPADVVQERRGEQQVVAEARVELRRLAAERRDADRVLEQTAAVAVVAVRAGGRKRAVRGANPRVCGERADERRESGVRDLRREKLVEPVELVGVAAERRRERRGIGVLRCFDRSHLHLQSSAEALDPSEDVHSVALAEALVEQVDVAPYARFDPSTRVGELEREIGGAGARTPPLLLRDREHTLDRPVLGELGDRRHAASLCAAGPLVPSPRWPR